MGKANDVTVGDFVFAKVRGYPAWPARIVSVLDPRPASLKYTVFFYGTSETATVQAKEVFPYAENKERFGKPMKRKFFNEGIQELEREMTEGCNSTQKKSNASQPNSETLLLNANDDEAKSNLENLVVPTVGKRGRENDEGEPVVAKRKRKGFSVEGMTSGAPTEVKEKNSENIVAVGSKRRKSAIADLSENNVSGSKERKISATEPDIGRRNKKSPLVEPAQAKIHEDLRTSELEASPDPGGQKRKKFLGGDTTESKEQISRSGRVIKPKKFLYDEEKEEKDEVKPKQKTVTAVEPNVNKAELTVKKSRKSKVPKDDETPDPKQQSPKNPPKLASMGRVIWARSKCGQLVQVKVDHERPTKFKDNKTRIRWEKDYEQQLKKVIKKIETGEYLPDDVPVQLQPSPERLVNMTEEEINACKKLRLMERKRGKVRWLKLETRLVDIDVLLKTCLQKTRVDTDKALQLIDELIQLPLDPLMLKKHPQLVETIRKIRQYTGNVQSWNMSEEEELQFKKNASKIRKKANILLNKFRGLFAVAKPDDFWNVFLNSVTEFKSLTKHLPAARVYSLIVDPSSPFYKEITELDQEEEEFGLEIMKKHQTETAVTDITENSS